MEQKSISFCHLFGLCFQIGHSLPFQSSPFLRLSLFNVFFSCSTCRNTETCTANIFHAKTCQISDEDIWYNRLQAKHLELSKPKADEGESSQMRFWVTKKYVLMIIIADAGMGGVQLPPVQLLPFTKLYMN